MLVGHFLIFIQLFNGFAAFQFNARFLVDVDKSVDKFVMRTDGRNRIEIDADDVRKTKQFLSLSGQLSNLKSRHCIRSKDRNISGWNKSDLPV